MASNEEYVVLLKQLRASRLEKMREELAALDKAIAKLEPRPEWPPADRDMTGPPPYRSDRFVAWLKKHAKRPRLSSTRVRRG